MLARTITPAAAAFAAVEAHTVVRGALPHSVILTISATRWSETGNAAVDCEHSVQNEKFEAPPHIAVKKKMAAPFRGRPRFI